MGSLPKLLPAEGLLQAPEVTDMESAAIRICEESEGDTDRAVALTLKYAKEYGLDEMSLREAVVGELSAYRIRQTRDRSADALGRLRAIGPQSRAFHANMGATMDYIAAPEHLARLQEEAARQKRDEGSIDVDAVQLSA
jgi:hypothetical protein